MGYWVGCLLGTQGVVVHFIAVNDQKLGVTIGVQVAT